MNCFQSGPERRGLFEVLREKLREVEFKRGALGFFPFILERKELSTPRAMGLFFLDEDFESLEFISGEGEKGK